MGAHHFEIYLIPQTAHPVREKDGSYAGDFLRGFEMPGATLQRLRALLPNPNPWGTVEEFNSPSKWGSDLRIFHDDDGKVTDVTMRFAPAGDSIQILRDFVEAVKDSGCNLFLETKGEVIPADFERVQTELRSHHSFRFLEDPEGAIKQAADDANQRQKPS